MEKIKALFADPAKAGKFLLIPVLAIILAYLVFGRGNSDATETERASSPITLRPGAARDVTPSRDNLLSPGRSRLAATRPAGPNFEIEQLLQSNPFSLPLELRPAEQPEEESPATTVELAQRQSEDRASLEAARREAEEAARFQARVEALSGKSTSIIASTSQGKVAFVDSRAVGVGDYLEDGVRVVEIGPDGIVVEVEPRE